MCNLMSLSSQINPAVPHLGEIDGNCNNINKTYFTNYYPDGTAKPAKFDGGVRLHVFRVSLIMD